MEFYHGNIFGNKYEAFFHGNWKKYSEEYINDLVDFTYHGWWQYDLLDKGKFFYFRKRIINKILRHTFWRNQPERTYNTMRNEITYCSHPTEDKFLESTRRYISKLFGSVSNDYDIVMVDQIVPPTNISRYIRYFENIQVIVVDRDPRDLYVLEKYVWKDGIIPIDVDEFCKWFRYTRDHRTNETVDSSKVMFIQFEDLIYKYNDTIQKIMDWLNLRSIDHTNKGQYFNPIKSMNNTMTWKSIKCDKRDIEFIERELPDYLYKFEEI